MSLPQRVLDLVSKTVDKRFPGFSTGMLDDAQILEQGMEENQRQLMAARAAVEATSLFQQLAMSSLHQPYVSAQIATEHMTIVGQTAKAVGDGILLAASNGDTRYCQTNYQTDIFHPAHDGRLTCRTVVGAVFMSQQPLI